MQVNYNFFQPENDSQNYYFYEDGFSKEELQKIEKGVKQINFEKAATVSGDSDSVRSSRIKWIPQNTDWWWLYEKLAGMATESNNTLWNFNLYSLPECIQYTEYLASENGKYDWHQDIGPSMLSKRKVSLTIQLSDPSEYEGGELQLFRGGNPETDTVTAPKKAGCVYIFPSYIMHRVTPVTKGVRKSFVLWLGGEHYK
jgi:PKHD-type hydroxylase